MPGTTHHRHRAGPPRARRGPLADPARRQAAERGRRPLVRPGQARPGRSAWPTSTVISEAGTPVIIVAHSAGVLDHGPLGTAARPAGPRSAAGHAAGPRQPLSARYPSLSELAEHGWLPIPRAALRFPSIVAASTNDALGDFERVRALADAWGSHFIDIGPGRPPQPCLRVRRLARGRGPAGRPERPGAGGDAQRPRRLTPRDRARPQPGPSRHNVLPAVGISSCRHSLSACADRNLKGQNLVRSVRAPRP